MRMLMLCLFLCNFSQLSFSAEPRTTESREMLMQELASVNEQIEALQGQKAELEASMAQHIEREDTSILPREDRRQSRDVQDDATQLEIVNGQIQELETRRMQIEENLNWR